jgi:uncharacterized protein
MDNSIRYNRLPNSIALKVIGKSADDFESFVVRIVRKHIPDLGREAIGIRTSRDGHYMSVNVEIVPRTKEQLDNIYKELVSHERIIMVL